MSSKEMKLKPSISIDYQEIINILRIITVCLALLVLSFVLIFYGILTAEGYFGCLLIGAVAVYVVVPVSFSLCPFLQETLVFQTHIDSKGVNFDNPDGIRGVKNIKLRVGNDAVLGLWHILPSRLSSKTDTADEEFWKRAAQKGDHRGVVIYFHGVSGTRGKGHRKELYKVLQDNDHHVISCDYRGFADSSKVPRLNESIVIHDALCVYRWVHSELLGNATNIPVYIWGHSMGAGVSSHFTAKLKEFSDIPLPRGVVLESPFNNFETELKHHSGLKLWSFLPIFDKFVIQPLHKSDISFKNDYHITKIPVPILILHGKDDNVIPSFLGKRLFDVGKQSRSLSNTPVFFVHLNGGKHNELCRKNLEFDRIISSFVDYCGSLGGNLCWHQDESYTHLEIHCSHCEASILSQ